VPDDEPLDVRVGVLLDVRVGALLVRVVVLLERVGELVRVVVLLERVGELVEVERVVVALPVEVRVPLE
jgi:hypothetical protein